MVSVVVYLIPKFSLVLILDIVLPNLTEADSNLCFI